MKRVMLYFGSFNPVHKGHIALAEYVVGQGLCDEAVLVVSPQSPYKQAAELAPEMDRFEMAEIAWLRHIRIKSNLRSWSSYCRSPHTQ